MQKYLDIVVKESIFACFFVSQLIFFTNFTQNPYIVQIFISVSAVLILLFVLTFLLTKKKDLYFLFSKTDIFVFIFVFIALLSLAVNSFMSPTPQAFLNEFWRRGYILISALFGGYFCARLFCNRETFLNFEGEENYKKGLSFFVWGLFWLPFSYFKMQGLFDVYGILMWGVALFLALKFLKEVNLRNILDLLLVTVSLSCAYGICQNLGYEFLWDFNVGIEFGSNAYSTFGNPNFLSSFIILFLPVGFVFLLLAKKKFAKIYYFCITLLLTVCLSVTGARSSFIGIIFAMPFFVFSGFLRKVLSQNKKTVFLLLGILILLFFIYPKHQDSQYKQQDTRVIANALFSNPRNLTLSAPKEAIRMSYHQRLMAWTCGVDNFVHKPLLGIGWGAWQLDYASCQGRLLNKYPFLKSLKTQSNGAHNIFIEILTQSGIIGFMAFCVFLFLTFGSFIKYYLKEENSQKQLCLFALFVACIAFLVDNLLNITSQFQVVCVIFYFFMGILSSLLVKKKQIKKRLLYSLLILFGIITIVFSVRQGLNIVASYYSLKGYFEIKKNNLQEAKKFLSKSVNVSKESVETYFAHFKNLEFMKDFSAQYQTLLETLTYYPFYYEFYYFAAPFEISLERPEEAFSYIKKSLELNPYYEPSLKMLINLLATFKSLRTLKTADFIEKLNLPLSYQNAYNILLAQIYTENNLPQKARVILLAELSKNKYDKTVQTNLGEIDKYLDIKNDSALKEALVLSDLRRKVNESKNITPALIKEIKDILQKEELEGNMLLAQAYFKQKEYDKSREILTDLYKKYADYLPLNFAFSSLEEAVGNKKEARKYLFNILNQDENNQLALNRLERLN